MGINSETRVKQFCKANNIDFDFYKKQIAKGLKWCTGCKDWHTIQEFNADKSRYDGLVPVCAEYKRKREREKYVAKPRPEKGRVFVLPRDDDRKQARRRVNHFVESKIIPHPNMLPCVDCGHIWKEGERRHEYDHYKGYKSDSHLLVESVCSACHNKRTKKQNGRAK